MPECATCHPHGGCTNDPDNCEHGAFVRAFKQVMMEAALEWWWEGYHAFQRQAYT